MTEDERMSAALISEQERGKSWAEKVLQIQAERDALKGAIERAREGMKAALAAWEPEHEYHRDRAERKGYSMNETAAEVYGDAIEVVTEAIAALDTSNGSGGSVATGGCTSNPAGTPTAPESPESEETTDGSPQS